MRVRQLIEALEEYQTEHGDQEVIVAHEILDDIDLTVSDVLDNEQGDDHYAILNLEDA